MQGFFGGKRKERDPIVSARCGWEDDIKIDFKSVAGARTRFILLRIGTNGGVL